MLQVKQYLLIFTLNYIITYRLVSLSLQLSTHPFFHPGESKLFLDFIHFDLWSSKTVLTLLVLAYWLDEWNVSRPQPGLGMRAPQLFNQVPHEPGGHWPTIAQHLHISAGAFHWRVCKWEICCQWNFQGTLHCWPKVVFRVFLVFPPRITVKII